MAGLVPPGLVGLWAGYLVYKKKKKNLVNDLFFFFGKVSCSRACGSVVWLVMILIKH